MEALSQNLRQSADYLEHPTADVAIEVRRIETLIERWRALTESIKDGAQLARKLLEEGVSEIGRLPQLYQGVGWVLFFVEKLFSWVCFQRPPRPATLLLSLVGKLSCSLVIVN